MNTRRIALLVALLLTFLLAGTAAAAEFAAQDAYRLPAGETLTDDLYITGGEIFIDGTLDGDLIAAAGYIEINGTVTGDVLAAGGGLRINGAVQDDVRAAGGGIDIAGAIGGDLILAGGGGPSSFVPMQSGGREIAQGVRIADGTEVAGDVVIGAGSSSVGGTIGGGLRIGAGDALINAQVAGDALVDVGTLRFGDAAGIAGTLRYIAVEERDIPPGIAEQIEFTPREQVEVQDGGGPNVFLQILRTVGILLGSLLVGWLLLRFAPDSLRRPALALRLRTGQAALYGILLAVVLIFVPLLSGLLIFAMAAFWGFLPAMVLFLFLFSGLALIWVLSPLITGLWIGRLVARTANQQLGDLAALMLGVAIIATIALIPFLGWPVYFVSFIMALGALLLVVIGGFDKLPPAPVEAYPG
jgi:hypothetical protein